MDWQRFNDTDEATVAVTDDGFIISAHFLNDRGVTWGYSIVGVPDPLRPDEKKIVAERIQPKANLAEVQEYCGRVAFIKDGAILAVADLSESAEPKKILSVAGGSQAMQPAASRRSTSCVNSR